jgi:tetratricopeptide (TPR) repeat protein
MVEQMLQKAEILIQSKRFKQAATVLEDVMVKMPDNPFVLGRYSQVLFELKEMEKGAEVINSAIALQPENDFLFYIKGYGHLMNDQYQDAEKALTHAIHLNPEGSIYFAMMANLKIVRKKYSEALKYADESLALDPENTLGLNARSTALLKLDRKEESVKTIQGALNENPNDPYTHANYGWSLLEQGKHKESLNHFAESLKIDPNFLYAQQGMMEALKAKYLLYRWFLKYAFAMGNLAAKYQWGIIIAIYLGTRFLGNLAENVAWLRPILIPIVVLLVLFAISTWIITPLSNLFLKLNTYGKHLLTKEQKSSSNFVGLSLLVCLFGGLAFLIFRNEAWLSVAVYGFAMMIPWSVAFRPAKYKYSLLIYAIGLAVVGAGSVLTTFATGELFNGFTPIFVFGFVAFQWIANFLSSDF